VNRNFFENRPQTVRFENGSRAVALMNIPLFHHFMWPTNVGGHKKHYISNKLYKFRDVILLLYPIFPFGCANQAGSLSKENKRIWNDYGISSGKVHA